MSSIADNATGNCSVLLSLETVSVSKPPLEATTERSARECPVKAAAFGRRTVTLNMEAAIVSKLAMETEAPRSTCERPTSGKRHWKPQPPLHKRIPEAPKPSLESPARNVSSYRRNTTAATFESVLPPPGHRHSQPLTLSCSSATHPPALQSSAGRSCHAHATAHASSPARPRGQRRRGFTTATQATRTTSIAYRKAVRRVSCSACTGSAAPPLPTWAAARLANFAPWHARVTPACNRLSPHHGRVGRYVASGRRGRQCRWPARGAAEVASARGRHPHGAALGS